MRCAKYKLIFAQLFAAVSLNAADTGVLRFWCNEGDVSDGKINGVEDREDFFPMLLDFKQLADAWHGKGVAFRLRGNGALNVAYTTISRNDVWALYRSDEVLSGESFDRAIDSAPLVQITPQGIDIPESVISRVKAGNDVVLACEVRPGANAGILQFEAAAGNDVLYRFPMGCYSSCVKDMYHWINLRHVNGKSEKDATSSVPPSNADWSDDMPHVFFVHGANVSEDESRVWCDKIFKRLHLSGAKMRFHGVSWCSQIAGDSDYHLNASNSFDVACVLASTVNGFSGRKVVIAHSLGTMLAANAIQYFGMEVDKVIFLNSAIPSESIDPSQFSSALPNPLVHDAWAEYPSRCWTALYHALGAGTDRAKLTWKNRYPLVVPKLFNMYSSGDEVLDLYPGNGNPGWSDGVWSSSGLGARFSWQKQELWKGRKWLLGFLGTTKWSGWGFRENILGINAWTAEEAKAVTDLNVFATNTVFKQFPVSITNSIFSEAEINAHLTQGIPALSRALGSVRVSNGGAISFDLNSKGMQYRPNGWIRDGSDFHDDWLHSDIKDVPYYFTHKVFDKLIEAGGLR